MSCTLAISIWRGAWLIFTRVTCGTGGSMSNADHLIGARTVTVLVIACAEVPRGLRHLNVVAGAALLVTDFAFYAGATPMIASLTVGVALIVLGLPRGPVRQGHGDWDRYIR